MTPAPLHPHPWASPCHPLSLSRPVPCTRRRLVIPPRRGDRIQHDRSLDRKSRATSLPPRPRWTTPRTRVIPRSSTASPHSLGELPTTPQTTLRATHNNRVHLKTSTPLTVGPRTFKVPHLTRTMTPLSLSTRQSHTTLRTSPQKSLTGLESLVDQIPAIAEA